MGEDLTCVLEGGASLLDALGDDGGLGGGALLHAALPQDVPWLKRQP